MVAIFDFLKHKEEIEKSKKADKPEKVSNTTKAKKEEKKKDEPKSAPKAAPVVKPGKNTGFSFEAVQEPRISEKATYLAEKDQYTFKVSPSYNKNEIKNAVEGIYGVNVLSVNIIKIPQKKRRLGKTQGYRKAFKKAVVRIKEGQKIEIL